MVLATVSLEPVSLWWHCDSKPEEKACSYRDLLTLTDEWLSIGKLSEDVSGTLEQKNERFDKKKLNRQLNNAGILSNRNRI